MATNENPPVSNIVAMAEPPKDQSKVKNTRNTRGNGGDGTGSYKAQHFGDYLVKSGSFYQSKATRDGGVVELQLCDFSCRIIEEVIADDGLNDTTYLMIEGRRADGVILPKVDVPSKSFYSPQSNWVNEHWGTLPFIFPGNAKRDNLRAAIHLYSSLNGNIPRRKVYKFCGWKKLEGGWHYLTGTGAVTATGLADVVQVDLGTGGMGKYQLPAPLAGAKLNQAIDAALLLLDICPSKPHIGAALLACVARAPLGECHPTDFMVWLHGLTGSRKSEIAGIAQGFFGDFTARSFPANWSDTDSDLEAKAFQAKDAIFVVDDFKPSVNQVEAQKLYAKAERIGRGTGNQSGRGRRTSTMQAQIAYYNRSMMLVTAEDLPRGQSLLGRMFIAEISRTDVENGTLTQLQKARDDGLLTGLMSAYLQWLAPRMDQLKQSFPKLVTDYRDIAINECIATSHPRAPEIYANLVAGVSTFISFLQEAGQTSTQRAVSLTDSIEASLQQAFKEQGGYQAEQDEVQRFLDILKACLSSGNAHIACRLNQAPPASNPFAWGWRDAGTEPSGDKALKPMGDAIGWYSDAAGTAPAEVWLQQDAAFKVAQQYARGQGDAILLSPSSLWRRMDEKGFVLQREPRTDGGKPKLTVKKVIAGVSNRVMVLAAASLVEPASYENKSPGQEKL